MFSNVLCVVAAFVFDTKTCPIITANGIVFCLVWQYLKAVFLKLETSFKCKQNIEACILCNNVHRNLLKMIGQK